jgi:LPXTG-motif cell wall-anchored protein
MRKVLIALGALVVAVAAAALPAGAGNIPMDHVFTISPITGETGTVVTFTATDFCPVLTRTPTGASVNAVDDTTAAISRVADPSSPSDFLADTLADPDGDWSLDYTIPDTEPVGDITFYAFCLVDLGPPAQTEGATAAIPTDYRVSAEYAPVVFTVAAPPASSTTTTSTSTTTTTTAPAPTITANPTNVSPGDSIAVTATGFAPGSNVVITLESDPVNLGSYVADSAGRIATSIVVPADFPAGNHTIKLTGTSVAGAVLVLTTGITVASHIQTPTTTVATVVATTTSLPQTGSSFTEPALIAGGALVLVGAVAVLAARRRRSSAR